MAIVADISGNKAASMAALGRATDLPLCSPNQTGTSLPSSANFAGEIYLDTSTGIKYRAAQSGSTPNWYQIIDEE